MKLKHILAALLLSSALHAQVMTPLVVGGGSLGAGGSATCCRDSFWTYGDGILTNRIGDTIWLNVDSLITLSTHDITVEIDTQFSVDIATCNSESARNRFQITCNNGATTLFYVLSNGLVGFGASSTQSSRFQMNEDTDNGTNNIRIIAPASLSYNSRIILPSDTGSVGDCLGITANNGSGQLTTQWIRTWTEISDSVIARYNGPDSLYIISISDPFGISGTGTVIGTQGEILGVGPNISEPNIIMHHDSVFFLTGGNEIFRIDTSFLLATFPRGITDDALHNNTDPNGNASNPEIRSGTWTPTKSNRLNLDTLTVYVSYWQRVGNVVTFGGQIDVDATAAASTATSVELSLPVASNFAGTYDCAGTAVSGANYVARVDAEATNDKIKLVWASETTSSTSFSFHGTYLVK